MIKIMMTISLNPCSNGILKYDKSLNQQFRSLGLNPCSNGILKYDLTANDLNEMTVLILVLMEY